MIVKKVFNNNVVLVRNDLQQELVVMGKGIGFNKYPKDLIEKEKIEKQFIFNDKSISEFNQLVGRIPLNDIELASEIIQKGKEELGYNLNDNILITLSDHISYMLKRMEEELFFRNPLHWEIKQIYPEEYKFSEKAVHIIRDKTKMEIPDTEAAFIALHFANAHLETKNMEETILLTKIIDNVLDIIKYNYGAEIDQNSYDYTRFISHLRYFVKRLLNGGNMENDTTLLDVVKLKYPKDYKCATKIKKYLEATYNWDIWEDELLYLTLHLNRLTSKI